MEYYYNYIYYNYMYNGILLSHKKWNNAICSNMDAPRDYHVNEVNQTETDIISFIYGI